MALFSTSPSFARDLEPGIGILDAGQEQNYTSRPQEFEAIHDKLLF